LSLGEPAQAREEGARLAQAIDVLVSEKGIGAAGSDGGEWRALLQAMAAVRSAGYAVLGRPAFLTDARLEALVAEARELRAGAKPAGHDPGQAGQLHADPGPVARKLVVDEGWNELCQEALGFERRPPYTAGYLYYEQPGAGIVPHVDDPDYAVNVIVVVSRQASRGQRSATVLHPAGQSPLRVVLEPGEAVLLEADGLVHAREPMREGEQVTVLSMGFARPAVSA
jgi:hypothetical protein